MIVSLIALVGAFISAEQIAQEVWTVAKPILEARRDPTPGEWATLNALADRAHAEMQQAARASSPGKRPDA